MKKERLTVLAVLALGIVGALSLAGMTPYGNTKHSLITPYPTIEGSSPSPIANETPKSSGNVEVLVPRVGDTVKSGFSVRGNARVFENVVSIRLSDKEGNVLVQTIAYANAPDVGQFGPFEKILDFETDSKEGLLEVYQASPRDGSEVDKVSVPLLFE